MKNVFLLLGFVLFQHVASAQNYKTIASGNFSDPAIWQVDYGSGFVSAAQAPVNVTSNYIQISSYDTVTLDVNVNLSNPTVGQSSNFVISAFSYFRLENNHHITAEVSANWSDNSELTIGPNVKIRVNQTGDFIRFLTQISLSTGGFQDFKYARCSIGEQLSMSYNNAGVVSTNGLISSYNMLEMDSTQFLFEDDTIHVENLNAYYSTIQLNAATEFDYQVLLNNSTLNLNGSMIYKALNYLNVNSVLNAGADAEIYALSNDYDPMALGRYIPVFSTLKKFVLNITPGIAIYYQGDLHITGSQGLQLLGGRLDMGYGLQYTLYLDQDTPVYGSSSSYVMGNVSVKVETASPTTYEYIQFPVGTVNEYAPVRVNLSTNGIGSCYLTAKVFNSIPDGSADQFSLGGPMSNRYYHLHVKQPNPMFNSNTIASVANIELLPTNVSPVLNSNSKIGFSFTNTANSYEGIASAVSPPYITCLPLSNAQIDDLGSLDGSYIGIANDVLAPGHYCIGPSASYQAPVGSPSYVNGSNPYGNLTVAIQDLQTKGSSGAITFVVQNDYTGFTGAPNITFETMPISINYQGDSARTLTITVRSDNASPILIGNSSNNGVGVMEFNGARFVTLQGSINNVCGNYGFKIRNNGAYTNQGYSGGTTCLSFKNDAKRILISGVQFDVADVGIRFNNNNTVLGSDSIQIMCNLFTLRSDLQNTNCSPYGVVFSHNGIDMTTASSNDVKIQYNHFNNMSNGVYMNTGYSGLCSILDNHFYRSLNNSPGPVFNQFIFSNLPVIFVIDGNYFGGSTSFCGGNKMNIGTSSQYLLNLSTFSPSPSTTKSILSNNHFENMFTVSTANLTCVYISSSNVWDVLNNIVGNPNSVDNDNIYGPANSNFFGFSISIASNAVTNSMLTRLHDNSFNNIYCSGLGIVGGSQFHGIYSQGPMVSIQHNSFKTIHHDGSTFDLIYCSNFTPLANQVNIFSYNTAKDIIQTNTTTINASLFRIENTIGYPVNLICVGNQMGDSLHPNDLVFKGNTVKPLWINIFTQVQRLDSNSVYNLNFDNTTASPHTIILASAPSILSCAYNTILNVQSKSSYIVAENANSLSSLNGLCLNNAGENNAFNVLVHHNKIMNLLSNNPTVQSGGLGVQGLVLFGVASNLSFQVYHNQIFSLDNASKSSGSNCYITGISFGSPQKLLLYNNQIGLDNNVFFLSPVNACGIRKYATNNSFSCYHNTIHIGGSALLGSTSYCLFKSTNNNGTDTLKNNIFNSTLAGGLNFCLGYDGSTVFGWGKSDYNCFFSYEPNQFGKWINSAMPFSTWKSTSSTEAHSFLRNVKFINQYEDLHLSDFTNCALQNAGGYLPNFLTDIDGELRNNPPDIGADEMTPLVLSASAFSQNTTVCETSSLQLESTTNMPFNAINNAPLIPLYYTWSGPASYVSSLQNPSLTNVQINQQGIYSVTVTDYYGCSASSTVAITIDPMQTWYHDQDGDGYSDGSIQSCGSPGANYTLSILGTGDCDDIHNTVHPNANEVCGNSIDDDCDGLVDEGCSSLTTVTLKAFIQGYYSGSSTQAPALFNQGVSNQMNETDTITVVLKISPLSFPDFELQTILQNDGFITFTLPSWVGTNNTNYWIGLKHRNGLETWSKTLVPFSMITMYDFSSAAEQAFGDNLVEVESGVWALYSGDLNQDGAIDAFDFLLMDPEIVNGSTGYFSSDLNGDGAVDAFDYLILDPNVIGGIGAAIP